jgi:formate dehydrogenase iron-sulfur subunit
MSRAVLVDLVRCMGCRACQVACKSWNDKEAELTQCLGCYDNPPGFSYNTWSLIQFNEVEYQGHLHWVFTKRQCMHCEHPGCASVCPVSAWEKTPEGPVIYHPHRCIGCRNCQYGCPFGVPSYNWDAVLGLVNKCTFCTDRADEGYEPACVKVCPTDALEMGERSQLIAEAYRRFDRFPDRYYHHIYGEKEAGGTTWLYISPVPFDLLGFPDVGTAPVTEEAVTVMNGTPVTIVAAVAALSGLYWLTKRKEQVAEHKSGTEEGK